MVSGNPYAVTQYVVSGNWQCRRAAFVTRAFLPTPFARGVRGWQCPPCTNRTCPRHERGPATAGTSSIVARPKGGWTSACGHGRDSTGVRPVPSCRSVAEGNERWVSDSDPAPDVSTCIGPSLSLPRAAYRDGYQQGTRRERKESADRDARHEKGATTERFPDLVRGSRWISKTWISCVIPHPTTKKRETS